MVDDERSIVELFSGYVQALGHMSKTALSADDALRLLTSPDGADIDTALVDIKMPGHDGAWLIEQMGVRFPWIRVVIATGLAELDPRVSLRRNVSGYLVKPFSAVQLSAILDTPHAE